jgi:HAD superfamily hydrolase (TIGR01509 family)
LTVSHFEAILFDLDGTLIDSERWHQQAELATYAEFGFRPTPEEMAESVGIPMSAIIRKLAARHGVAMSPDDFRERHRPRLCAYIETEMTIFDDVVDCLADCDGVPIGIVTSSENWYVQKVIERFAPHFNRFHPVICADDAPKNKPDPSPYLYASQLLGVDASRCIAVEDSLNGIASAVAAGCRTVAVDRQNRLHPRSDAVRYIHSLSQLLRK